MKRSIFFVFLSLLLACRQNQPDICRIIVSLSGTSADSVFIRKISLNNGRSPLIDSGLLRFSRDSLEFEVPRSSESLYQLNLKFSYNQLYLIPDQSSIRIIMNMKTHNNIILGSPATESLSNFTEQQDNLIRSTHVRLNKPAGILNHPIIIKQKDSIQRVNLEWNKELQQRFYNYADTVSNPISFLVIYNEIEFDTAYSRMKTLSARAAARFKNSKAVKRLNEQVINLISIYEKELQVGDFFPELQLPDLNSKMHSTKSIQEKYLFIDFWASWCTACQIYDPVRMKLGEIYPENKLALIHVAMDNHITICREIIQKLHLEGIQLIDTNMWQGETAKNLYFDSIPFNFLVGPDHRILAKAIPADSLVQVLKSYIKK